MTRTPQPAAVALHDVGVTLGGRPVVRQVDLSVAPGEFVTLLGSNGSGKSTLVRACVRLLPLTTGRVELFGTPLEQIRDWRRIGYVPQRSTAASGVPSTVGEVVTTGRLARRRYAGWPTRADRRAVADALALVELSERANDPVAQLSGGQQQRVMIARALAGEPDLLVMDEPTAGVDRHSQQVLAGMLRRMLDDGTTVVMVAHELGPFEPMVDRAVLLRDGRIAYEGEVSGITAGNGDHHHPQPPDADGTAVPPEGIWP